MSSSNQKSNARLAIYTAPVVISFIFALATGGAVNLPFVAILSSIQTLLGKEGFTFVKEALTLLGAGGVNLLTGEAHERIKNFFKNFQSEKLLNDEKFKEAVKNTIIHILNEEKDKPEFADQKENIERLVKALEKFYEKTIEFKTEDINQDIQQAILNSFIYEANDLTRNTSPLNADEWKNLLEDTAIINSDSFYEEGVGFRLNIPTDFRIPLDKLAKSLAEKFPKRFQNFLERDLAEDGETFAKFVLDFLKRIDNSGDEIKNILAEYKQEIEKIKQNTSLALQQGQINQAELREFLDKISRQIENLQNALSSNHRNVSIINISQTNIEIRNGFRIYGNQLNQVISTLNKLPSQVADELEKRKLISQNSKPKGLINVSKDGKTFFMEQGTVLEDLETQLKSKHIACLHGKHGLGKTTNVQEFARRQTGNYDLIVFLAAAEKILETSIIEFADRHVPDLNKLSLLERQQIKPETKFELFQTFFEDNELWRGEKRGWLLIFDNLESREQIRRYFPNTNNGDILYTCNDDLYLDEKCEVPIREFSPTEAELFLYKRNEQLKDAKHADIPPEALADIRKILHDYGRLPFVVNKFRNYLSQIQISYAAFYEELKNNEKRYFELPASNDTYQYKNEIIAYFTSFEKIKPQENQSEDDRIISRLAVAMLNISAFCFPDQIPEEILKKTLFRNVDTSGTTISNETLFAEAFRLLQRFDLLNSRTEIFAYLEKKETPEVVYLPFKKEETVYQSHRTIQKIIKLNLENETKKEILNAIIIVLKDLIPWSYLETWKIYEKYLSNVENIIEEARKLELATEKLGYICNQFGFYQEKLAQYQNAIKFYQQAIEIDEQILSELHPNYATHLNNLANVYYLQGRYDKAMELYKQVIKIDEQTIGKEHPDYAFRLNNLASVYQSQGRYDEAIELYKQALEIDEQTIGKEDSEYAVHLSNLALVYKLQGRYNEAIELCKQVLEIDEQTIGKEHPAHAFHLGNLAVVYDSQGRYDEAIELYKQTIAIDEQTIGKEHPNYAVHLSNLALVYTKQEKYQEALDLYEQAVKINEETLPENHPYTIQDRESVARCKAILGK
jgi:tetratricopeptide (TPR) repeat protein